MKLAIMQPYIFPYIGYFSLIHSVDKFVFFDDVNFIKRGWINRNKILSSKKELLFSIPLKKASQNKLINEIFIADEVPWEDKLLRTIEHSYGREPGFIKAYPLIEEVVRYKAEKISELANFSIMKICKYLEIERDFVNSSALLGIDLNKRGQDRIIDICKNVDADTYNNAIGGMSLYSKDLFKENNIKLNFISPIITPYNQSSEKFISHLSIIDILMYNKKEDVIKMIESYEHV
jgi:hypothetical protein